MLIDKKYEQFKKDVFKLTGIDLEHYKEQQMKRRLTSLMNSYGTNSFADYTKMIAADGDVRKRFLDKMTINVTEFFRNPEKFELLRTQYLADLIRPNGSMRVWSAGCSRGVEAYTLAMILTEYPAVRSFEMIATDLDDRMLAVAKAGIYQDYEMKQMPPKIKEKYMTDLGEGSMQVSSALRSRIRFKHHDLLQDSFGVDYDLILCRNVVIYFTDESKQVLYRRFTDSLRPEGLIFIGSTERIVGHAKLGLKILSPFFYQKEGK